MIDDNMLVISLINAAKENIKKSIDEKTAELKKKNWMKH